MYSYRAVESFQCCKFRQDYYLFIHNLDYLKKELLLFHLMNTEIIIPKHLIF